MKELEKKSWKFPKKPVFTRPRGGKTDLFTQVLAEFNPCEMIWRTGWDGNPNNPLLQINLKYSTAAVGTGSKNEGF